VVGQDVDADAGDDVRERQRKLIAWGSDAGKEGGVHGQRTGLAVRDFQRNVGEVPDGMVGLHTIAILQRMRPLEDVPSRAVVREVEELRGMRGSIHGKIIVIDPGDGPADGPEDVRVAMAASVAEHLAGLGAKPEILHGDTAAPSDRARAANERGARHPRRRLPRRIREDAVTSRVPVPTLGVRGSTTNLPPAPLLSPNAANIPGSESGTPGAPPHPVLRPVQWQARQQGEPRCPRA